ncbi:MAG: hypothetical protein ACOC9S_04075 [Planctomycetota bacterium]
MSVLVDEQLIASGHLQCPSSSHDRQIDYFYHPPKQDAYPGTLVVCDFRGNHDGYRNFVDAGGTVSQVSEDEFQELLKKPENADFARALREAEGP